MPPKRQPQVPTVLADAEKLALWTASAGGCLLTEAPQPDDTVASPADLMRAEARIVAAAPNRDVGLLVTGLMAAGVIALSVASEAEFEAMLSQYSPTPDGAYDILSNWNQGDRSMADLVKVCHAAADYANEYMAILGMAIVAMKGEQTTETP